MEKFLIAIYTIIWNSKIVGFQTLFTFLEIKNVLYQDLLKFGNWKKPLKNSKYLLIKKIVNYDNIIKQLWCFFKFINSQLYNHLVKTYLQSVDSALHFHLMQPLHKYQRVLIWCNLQHLTNKRITGIDLQSMRKK